MKKHSIGLATIVLGGLVVLGCGDSGSRHSALSPPAARGRTPTPDNSQPPPGDGTGSVDSGDGTGGVDSGDGTGGTSGGGTGGGDGTGTGGGTGTGTGGGGSTTAMDEAIAAYADGLSTRGDVTILDVIRHEDGSATVTFGIAPSGELIVVRFDPAAALVWGTELNGRGTRTWSDTLMLPDGSTLILGSFDLAVTFPDGTELTNTSQFGAPQGFAALLDPAGNLLWAVRMGGVPDQAVILPDGSAVIVGTFEAWADFGSGDEETILTATGASAFVAHYDADGSLRWADAPEMNDDRTPAPSPESLAPTWSVPTATDEDVRLVDGVEFGGALIVDSGVATLTSGKYVFSSLQLESTARLICSGGPDDVIEIFVTDADTSFVLDSNASVDLEALDETGGPTVIVRNAGRLLVNSNSRVNVDASGNPGDPTRFVYYSTYASAAADDHGVTIDSNSRVSGLIYVPAASIYIASNSDLYGAMVALNVIAE